MLQCYKSHARIIRQDILDMIYHAKASHIGSCYSVVDILNFLYGEILNITPETINSQERDFLIMSKGHAAAALYATLAYYGFFPRAELNTYCKNGSRLAGHVTASAPGVEFSTGALGHGLSFGCGLAFASSNKVYVIQSDGECNEGAVWEAALFAAHHRLNNLTLIIDYNKLQGFGRVNGIINLENLTDKWTAFNWTTVEIDGHDYSQLKQAFSLFTKQPKVIIAHTIKGKGVSYMEDNLLWHYKSPDAEQYQLAKEELML